MTLLCDERVFFTKYFLLQCYDKIEYYIVVSTGESVRIKKKKKRGEKNCERNSIGKSIIYYIQYVYRKNKNHNKTATTLLLDILENVFS